VIVADSSVWIAALRGEASAQTEALRSAAENRNILVGDLILLEVLQGARDERHSAFLQRSMARFDTTSLLDSQLALKAAANFRHLRRLGITVRKTVDLIIATFCIENGHYLLHQDRDYTHFVRHLGLKLAV
jgi:predicted nucleic acid-binding protein